jgi:hypothetical protein
MPSIPRNAAPPSAKPGQLRLLSVSDSLGGDDNEEMWDSTRTVMTVRKGSSHGRTHDSMSNRAAFAGEQ